MGSSHQIHLANLEYRHASSNVVTSLPLPFYIAQKDFTNDEQQNTYKLLACRSEDCKIIPDLLSLLLGSFWAWPSSCVGSKLQPRVYYPETNTGWKERGSSQKRRCEERARSTAQGQGGNTSWRGASQVMKEFQVSLSFRAAQYECSLPSLHISYEELC